MPSIDPTSITLSLVVGEDRLKLLKFRGDPKRLNISEATRAILEFSFLSGALQFTSLAEAVEVFSSEDVGLSEFTLLFPDRMLRFGPFNTGCPNLFNFLLAWSRSAEAIHLELPNTPAARGLFEQVKIDYTLDSKITGGEWSLRAMELIAKHHPELTEIWQLCEKSDKFFLQIPGFGQAALRDLKINLGNIGLSLDMGERIKRFKSRLRPARPNRYT